MSLLYKSTASQVVMLKLFLSSDHVTAATGKTVAITISKAGAAFGNPNAGATNATEVSNGWYKVTLDATDTNTVGDLVVRGTATSCDDTERIFRVVLPSNFDVTSIDSNGRVDIIKIAGTTQTARDIGASVLLSSGTGAGQISLSSGAVTVGTNNDKTGYSLSQTFPTNFSALAITVGGAVTVGTNNDKTGYTASTVSDKTGYSIATGGIGSGATAAAELNNIADGILDRVLSAGTDSGGNNTTARTVRQALRALRNKVNIAAGTMTVYKEDDTTSSWTSAITTTAGNPVTTSDPT